METDLLTVAATAFGELFTPMRLAFLALGVVIGLILGVIPGMSGLVGLSLLLPFTFDMDITTALAFLLGLSSVVVTSDTIPAVLFGVPGTVGSAATVLDGYPMARRGRAAEAFGAAFSASVIGGLFGAIVLAVSVPVLRPIMLQITTPELLGVCILGLALVSVLSGGAPMKGIIACCLGLALTTIGDDSQTATLRWTAETIYLYDGLPIVPVALGLFAIPEIADLAIARKNIAGEFKRTERFAQLAGVRATIRRLFLVVRCSSIGSFMGAMPGIGASIIDWVAYAHARATEKKADESFGKGDVRGVIASESANNAKEGGALIPTIAFGVPGSASMAILLGAFVIQGINPGPNMLTENLSLTYAMVWSVAIANILGAGICFVFANQFARIALVPIGFLAPIVLAFVFVGAFQGSSSWGDIAVLFGIGAFGFVMKRFGWPRPPLILGFVLGTLIERYSFISVNRYGLEWTTRPAVAILLVLAIIVVLRPLFLAWKRSRAEGTQINFGFQKQELNREVIFIAALVAVFIFMYVSASAWPFGARMFPQSIAVAALLALAVLIGQKLFFGRTRDGEQVLDIVDGELSEFSTAHIARRAASFASWCGFFVVAAQVFGFIIAMGLFTLGFTRFDGQKKWKHALLLAGAVFVVSYLLFHVALRLHWPDSYIGAWFPQTRATRWTDIF